MIFVVGPLVVVEIAVWSDLVPSVVGEGEDVVFVVGSIVVAEMVVCSVIVVVARI